jgi:hypothetical protein
MKKISHNINDESIEAKVLWFRALPISERMKILCEFTDLALELNPDLAEKKDAQPTKRRFCILLDALLEAGMGTASLTDVDEILSNEITIFKDRVRIDVQTSTPGLIFQDAWARRNTLEYQGQSFYVVSREDLISSKKAAGRTVDLDDVRLLTLPIKKDDA